VWVSGGLDEALYNVIAMAREQEIPFVFALGRKALGRCVNKLVPVSVVGIFNFSGAEVSRCYPVTHVQFGIFKHTK
jgi:ribosomal protein L7Ae-like RNA K-turn-binding protein